MPVKTFEKFEAIALKLAKKAKKNTEELTKLGEKLAAEFEKTGYIRMLPAESMNTDYVVFIPLIRSLLKKLGHKDAVTSPIEKLKDSSWMADASFSFINVRGSGTIPNTHGDFINAAKLLPVFRVSSIHLAPFFECALEIIYGIDSTDIVDANVLNDDFLKAGMKPEEQVQFFVDFAHLLGKTVGFDIEPHTSQFSRIAITNPQHFRWIELESDKKHLAGKMTQKDMLEKKNQEKIYKEVASIRDTILKKYSLTTLEQKGKDTATKPAHYEIIAKLIEKGLWTIPSHTWKGAGLPEFAKYGDGYPEFKYLATSGEDHRSHAFGTLTPFKFYDGIPMNRIPTEKEVPTADEETIKFFTGIFPRLYKKFRFDYLRFDYVDHVWDSISDKLGKVPVSDRITPYVLKKTIVRARSGGKAFIGAMAERMGTDIQVYKRAGFNLLLGDDVLKKIGMNLIKDAIKLNQKLEKLNARSKSKVSVQFAIDTHDTGHPLFNLTPMLLYGYKGVALRQFVARFCGWGSVIRPKYEVMGNQDGSVGLYLSNNKTSSIEWKSDVQMNATYHNIEDVFDQTLPELKKAKFTKLNTIKGKIAYWILESDKELIVPVCNVSEKSAILNAALNFGGNFKKIVVIDPYTNTRQELKTLDLGPMAPLESRLVIITK